MPRWATSTATHGAVRHVAIQTPLISGAKIQRSLYPVPANRLPTLRFLRSEALHGIGKKRKPMSSWPSSSSLEKTALQPALVPSLLEFVKLHRQSFAVARRGLTSHAWALRYLEMTGPTGSGDTDGGGWHPWKARWSAPPIICYHLHRSHTK